MKTVKNYFKLRYKIILIFIIISAIPISVLSYYLTFIISKNSIEQSMRIYSQSTRQLTQNLLNRLNSYYTTAANIAYNHNIINYLNEDSKDELYIYEFSPIIKPLIDKVTYNGSNMELKIYTDNDILKFAGIFVRDEKIYKKYLAQIENSRESINWNRVFQANKKNYMSFIMPITDYMSNNEIIGILECIIDLSDLQTFVSADSPDNLIFVLSGDNLILSSVNRDMDVSYIFSVNDRDKLKYMGKEYLLAKNYISDKKMNIQNWSIFNLISLEQINEDKRSIQITSLLVCAICIVVSIILLVFLSRSITNRIEILISRMNEISKGAKNLSVIVRGKDEIAQLSYHFDKMITDLNQLMAKVYESKLRENMLYSAQKEAQLLALQNQINPHYLFNTLESIRMNLLLKGEREISEIVKLFADSFRVMISDSRNMITIGDELSFIQKYFKIQRYRLDNKIDMEVYVSEELQNYKIPKFLLQPLIENAIFHGLELKGDCGVVKLSISCNKQNLSITVSDDGLGISEEELRELLNSINSNEADGKNFALRNIAKRLRLLYGDRSNFDIKSEPGRGTAIYITIPVENLEKDVK